jgi:hypothetical protein
LEGSWLELDPGVAARFLQPRVELTVDVVGNGDGRAALHAIGGLDGLAGEAGLEAQVGEAEDGELPE